ncbi:PoNi-like cognate immunity protein [Hymenobacter terrenus]|uniref:PoNi-like cognate immunity protein n=1 Tax=Hymenobacter terrenus TaxID=1629124 RepID=UPI000696FCD9|nr:PoNi-like cognate immunity protein [Hymenobacter terrenus]
MTKREPLQSEAYFDELIAFKKMVIARDQTALSADPKQFARPDALAFFLFSHGRILPMAEYSRGYPVADFHASLSQVINSLEQLRALDPEGTFAMSFKSDMDDYVRALWLVSQAILLRLENSLIERLLACIGNEGQDLLFERLVAVVAPNIGRKQAKKLLYPKVYQSLYDSIDAPAEQQAALVQQFLKNWYKGMRKTAWYDSHKETDSGFFGYWCWEAAGVAHAFGIDDSSFRDMPYYPKDLADFARTPKLT